MQKDTSVLHPAAKGPRRGFVAAAGALRTRLPGAAMAPRWCPGVVPDPSNYVLSELPELQMPGLGALSTQQAPL